MYIVTTGGHVFVLLRLDFVMACNVMWCHITAASHLQLMIEDISCSINSCA